DAAYRPDSHECETAGSSVSHFVVQDGRPGILATADDTRLRQPSPTTVSDTRLRQPSPTPVPDNRVPLRSSLPPVTGSTVLRLCHCCTTTRKATPCGSTCSRWRRPCAPMPGTLARTRNAGP